MLQILDVNLTVIVSNKINDLKNQQIKINCNYEYFIHFVSLYMCNSKITMQFLQLRYVPTTIFGHHQVVFIQSLSTLCYSPSISQYLRLEEGHIFIVYYVGF
jgi:hypothetical protein